MKHRETFPLDCRINVAVSFISLGRYGITVHSSNYYGYTTFYKGEKKENRTNDAERWTGVHFNSLYNFLEMNECTSSSSSNSSSSNNRVTRLCFADEIIIRVRYFNRVRAVNTTQITIEFRGRERERERERERDAESSRKGRIYSRANRLKQRIGKFNCAALW
jgi:hypothetical protein